MRNSIALTSDFGCAKDALSFVLVGAFLIFLFQTTLLAQAQFSTTPDEKTMIVDDAPEMEVYALGKSVVVKKRAKGVLAFGGDVIVEGRVDGDVASIGGSVIQKRDAYIGGDVIVFGGAYKPEDEKPLREAGKETVMFGMFEEEIRNLANDPTQLFSPAFSLAFFAQRVLSVLFWFVISLGLTTLAPGAVSRAIARIQLSLVKVLSIGALAFVVTLIGVIGSVKVLPNYLSVTLGLMTFVLMMLAYVFGRVAVHVSLGKIIQKYLLSEKNKSETLAILLGVLFWTIILSVPYIWTIALFALFATGLGLVLTARSTTSWQHG